MDSVLIERATCWGDATDISAIKFVLLTDHRHTFKKQCGCSSVNSVLRSNTGLLGNSDLIRIVLFMISISDCRGDITKDRLNGIHQYRQKSN